MNAPISFDPRAFAAKQGDTSVEEILFEVERDTRVYRPRAPRPRLVTNTHIIRDVAITFACVFIAAASIVSMLPA